MFLKKVLSIVLGVLFAFFLCEIVLRIYNPFQSRVRGNEIILKSNYKRKSVIDPQIKGLDPVVFYSSNSIGFRGPEPPKKWEEATSIVTIGGSTTECSLLSDDSTWPAKLYKKLGTDVPNLWLNNAGMDGCSSYGHLILMRDYIVKLKPDYAIFLIGINDLVKSSFAHEDGFLINRPEAWWRKLLKKSELITTLSNLYEAIKSQKAKVSHGTNPYDYKNNDLNVADPSVRITTEENLKKFIPEYVTRLKSLIEICRSNNIRPIFITQPKFDDVNSYSWQVMEKYNDAMIDLCKKENVESIDLGHQMPKDISFYYDQIHYTNQGAERIAQILAPQILEYIQKQ
jgi:lysophospholipase L1-like esterase